MHNSKGEYDRAIELHTKALTISRAALGEDHPRTLRSRNNLLQTRRLKSSKSRRRVKSSKSRRRLKSSKSWRRRALLVCFVLVVWYMYWDLDLIEILDVPTRNGL